MDCEGIEVVSIQVIKCGNYSIGSDLFAGPDDVNCFSGRLRLTRFLQAFNHCHHQKQVCNYLL